MANRTRVVLDPGHGGSVGIGGSSPNNATGPSPRSLKEKDLTLRLSALVEERLRESCDVMLTRNSDRNLALADRAALARADHADLFLSIHFNSFADASVDGTEVWVAANASPRSRSFAQTVLNRLVLVTGVANRNVRERNLGVLLASRHDAGTAACLAEIAFLTNARQAARLEDPEYLAQIADALAGAVRAQAVAVVAQAAAAGNGRGHGHRTPDRLPHAALLEPDPIDDQRYATSAAAHELERLYALPLESTVRTVIDADSRLRKGPPTFATMGTNTIPRFTRVTVLETSGAYCRVTGLDGAPLGWTAASNLGSFFKDDPGLTAAELAPATPIAIETTWSPLRKALAGTYNRLGGLMQVVATQTSIELPGILAVWYVESAGRSHVAGQAIIRFENHLLFGTWGKQHAQEYDRHFQFGTRAPATGASCAHRWQCHTFRDDEAGEFASTHHDQHSEYRALDVATRTADEATALRCISIGGSQILVMNHATIGHETPRQMYDAFQADERAHVLGFFDYCLFSQKKGMLLDALREGRWRDFAAGYNGAGRATEYGHQIESAAENAAAVLATRPAVAQGLDVTLGDQSVDVQFAVPLIPQPDKLSCWAGSMAMLVSYYRQASLTPESLAAQVSRSLRTSYGWDMLTSVRQHFLFKEVALPSNLSFVPPPSDWCHWLQQFGPLWITVVGNPSHAVVVAGISGDLTPSGTFIRVLNPWDDRAAFDGDPVDFHPPNTGHEETYSFADFSSMFGNMGLSDYGDWRVLYLGRRDVAPAEAQGVDLIDLSPEEIADAEPSGPPAAEANAVQAMTLARALGASDVRWAADDRSIDYRHLGAPGMSSQFILTPAILEQLCALNRFDVSAGQDEVLFGMRGCEVTGAPPAGFTASVTLSETIPDHTGARCLLGVWKRSAGQFRIFPASTVPNWTLMERFRQGGKRANLLPTGAYLYKVGAHRAGTTAEVPGAFLEAASTVILRTLDDLDYTIGDTWDSGDVGDNIHPARLDERPTGPFFSSAGCQTVPGNVKNGRHTGTWAEFRAAAGLSASSPASENGRRFVYVLITGRDARLAAERGPADSLVRLRFGSSGTDVSAIQLQLRAAGHLHAAATGVFDVLTKLAYIAWQRARSASTADGVVTPSDAASLGVDMIHGASTLGTGYALENGTGRSPARRARAAGIGHSRAVMSWSNEGRQLAACAADVAVDEQTAQIFSEQAPLANQPDCDARAVWTYVPDPLPSPPSVLLYFHGNDATVTVDAQHPGGRLPGWNRTANPAMHAFTPDGPFTPGLKYDIGGAVQSTPPHPLVLIPEVGIPGHWAKTSGGTLVSDPAALSRLIDDAWAHLATLNRPSGVPYLAGGPQCPSLRRMFLAAHSGGGVALGPAAMSSVATSVPTDLWLMDCTYNFGVEEKYVEFCRLWKQRGKLGRDAQSSRMVIIAGVQSVKTTNGANSIVQRLRAGWQDADGQAHAGLSAVRYTHGQFCPISGSCPPEGITPAEGTDIVEVMGDATWDQIDDCLRRFAVVYVHTSVAHDEIPLRYFPHLLNTAALP